MNATVETTQAASSSASRCFDVCFNMQIHLVTVQRDECRARKDRTVYTDYTLALGFAQKVGGSVACLLRSIVWCMPAAAVAAFNRRLSSKQAIVPLALISYSTTPLSKYPPFLLVAIR
ncbi:unnamed protein product [Ceratitis capitata]|uniref:(Mediterranean fruit fly) hypothetical protein n=1 Tax=Ceratitis capitata TaxID=7213 RepID=A0A811TZS1_CERCA|nr:unnamed protein product [Ceratitis capitata]